MKIGLLFEDFKFSNLDLRYPENGNQGIGGTEFTFLMLMRYLKINYPDMEIITYHNNKNNILPEGVISKIIIDDLNLIKQVKEDLIDIFIFRSNKNNEWYKKINDNNIRSIVWAHNYVKSSELNVIAKANAIKRLVFVGKQQYDTYIDHDVINKSIYIYNMFNCSVKEYNRKKNLSKTVTYTGSLVYTKGFHILAKEWKKILKEVPDAKLNIIGSGKLYDRNSKLGKYNVADEKYEDMFMKYLVDENGDILESVNFLGVLGQEKLDIYNNTMVGIINPSGMDETFGISAVEMEACGIPIVSKKVNGLVDTIKDKETGLLSYSKRRFRKDIIYLLKNEDINNKLGCKAKEFVSKEFDPNFLVIQWKVLFDDILKGNEAIYIKPNNYFFNNYKWLRIINRNIKKISIFKSLPAIAELKELKSNREKQ